VVETHSQHSCGNLQEPTFSDFAKFAWARRNHNSATGHLLDNPKPSPADHARAFPVVPPNYAALASPASKTFLKLQSLRPTNGLCMSDQSSLVIVLGQHNCFLCILSSLPNLQGAKRTVSHVLMLVKRHKRHSWRVQRTPCRQSGWGMLAA